MTIVQVEYKVAKDMQLATLYEDFYAEFKKKKKGTWRAQSHAKVVAAAQKDE